MSSRRHFLKTSSLASGIVMWREEWTSSISELLLTSETAVDWDAVRAQFPITTWDKIHFNSGSAGVMPIVVEESLIALSRLMNRAAPYEAWSLWQESHKDIKARLGSLINTDAKDISLVRNTTEALNMISTGLRLNAGDEILMAAHDYPYADHTWINRRDKSALTINKIKITLPAEDEDVVAAYRAKITPKTRVLHITHMTHREGHIMPVKALVALATEHGLITVIDGAHIIGQLTLDIRDINPDFYVSSLHKWLNAPHGNGLLYVNPNILDQMHVYPSAPVSDGGTSMQFAHLGTRAFHIEVGIEGALDFHHAIGAEAKYDRLQWLKHYWTDQLIDHPKVKWYTDLDDQKSCGVVTIGIDDISGGTLRKQLDENYDIHAKSVSTHDGSAVRISPNIFTNTAELDKLVMAIKGIAEG